MPSLAFAGAGWVTAVHGLAAAGAADLPVVRVASRTARSAARRARQTGAEACGYDELPGGADAVLVATPPSLHLREATRAVEAGAAALVEAPLAHTLDAADLIVALAANAPAGPDRPGPGAADPDSPGAEPDDPGRPPGAAGGAGPQTPIVAYGENLVHAPAVVAGVRACRGIGALTFLEVRVADERPDRHDHLEPAWGGGALFHPGAHAVALALLMAAPARVVAAQAQLAAGGGLAAVDDDASVTLTFDTGLEADVRVTWRAAAPAWHAQAASRTSAVHVELVPTATTELDGVPLTLPPPPPGLASPQLHDLGYVAQLAALAADVSARRPARCGPAVGRAVLEVICAAYTSARTGRPEAVPFTGPRDRTPLQLWHPDTPGPG